MVPASIPASVASNRGVDTDAELTALFCSFEEETHIPQVPGSTLNTTFSPALSSAFLPTVESPTPFTAWLEDPTQILRDDAYILGRLLLEKEEFAFGTEFDTPQPLIESTFTSLLEEVEESTLPRWSGSYKTAAASTSNGCGRRCMVSGCTKTSQSGGRCIRHGGGKRCSVEGCTRGAQATGRCKSHGGGVRCKVEGCDKGSQGSGLCRTHGGGKLCTHPGCKKGTQRGGKCSTHGGARICRVDGCTKVDRGGGVCGRHRHLRHQLA